MTEHVEPVAFLVALTLIVAAWLIVGIRALRRSRREARALAAHIVERHRVYVRRGRCGAIWFDTEVRWCDRPNDHTGPHLDSPVGELRREDESFVGGPGIRVHTFHR